MKTLLVNEMFVSIQGESTFAGLPCFFIRLSGCNLKCRYCDSVYAREKGRITDIKRIIQKYADSGTGLCEITGGEPLLQRNACLLAQKLLTKGAKVLVETNGSVDISGLPPGVVRIVDVKCPGSGEGSSFLKNNVRHLKREDELKFVITGKGDFVWAVNFMKKHRLADRVRAVLFSPVHGRLNPARLAGWIIESGLDVRLQLQIHKLAGMR